MEKNHYMRKSGTFIPLYQKISLSLHIQNELHLIMTK